MCVSTSVRNEVTCNSGLASPAQDRRNATESSWFWGFTLPKVEHIPSETAQKACIPFIAPLISGELRTPVFGTGFRNPRINATLVLVPKAPAHFDDLLQARK